MVSWKLERKMYHANIEKHLIGKYCQLFYLTNPTDEQLEILDARERMINSVFLITLIVGFILGCISSYGFYFFLKEIGVLL